MIQMSDMMVMKNLPDEGIVTFLLLDFKHEMNGCGNFTAAPHLMV